MDLFETLGLGPKPVQENIVFYALYPDTQPTEPAQLLALHAQCLQVIRPLLEQGYIWQLQAFNLTASCVNPYPWKAGGKRKSKARQEQGAPDYPDCLWGSVAWGDNVEDEWFIVYLLRLITATIPSVSAQVWDNDGEFLLIEAAYALPRWLKPDTATHRVWLRGGTLHIIPQPSSKAPNLPAFPTLRQAIQVLASGEVATSAPKAERLISERLQGFPDSGVASGRHRCRVSLPARLAAVLQAEPQLVAAAVEAFFYRDADDMKAAARMSHFPPSDPRVTTVIATNRCQYAQLAQQRFLPPRGWQLPPPGHPLAAAAERGLKITAGFEILVARAKRMGLGLQPAAVAAMAADQQGHKASCEPSAAAGGAAAAGNGAAAATGAAAAAGGAGAAAASVSPPGLQHPLWAAYHASLARSGYFQGEMEGSHQYKQLLAVALQDFEQAITAQQQEQQQGQDAGVQGQQHSGSRQAAPARLLQLLGCADVQAASAQMADQAAAGEGPGQQVQEEEDDDSWMDGLGEQLDMEMDKREQGATHSSRHKQQPGQGAREREVDADQLVRGLRSFMSDDKSGLEGAEVHPSGGVSFNPQAFLQQLEQVLSGQLPPQQRAVGFKAGNGSETEGDEWETDDGEDEEGSSFFSGSDESEGESEEEGEVDDDVLERAYVFDTTPNFTSNTRQQPHQPTTVVATTAEPTGAGAASMPGSQQGGLASQQQAVGIDSRTQTAAAARAGVQLGGQQVGDGSEAAMVQTAAAAAAAAAAGARVGVAAAAGAPVGAATAAAGRVKAGGATAGAGAGAGGSAGVGVTSWPAKPALASLQESWEVFTATDSDDTQDDSDEDEDSRSADSDSDMEEPPAPPLPPPPRQPAAKQRSATAASTKQTQSGSTSSFFSAYSTVLEEQLASTTLSQTVERANTQVGVQGGVQGTGAAAAAADGTYAAAPPPLTPLDLDMNLVRSLLKSVGEQQGLAGPASNLAGMLGVDLPHHSTLDEPE